MSAPAELPATVRDATAGQPSARLALGAALRAPSHAYLLTGPGGTGKRAAARALAAELLTAGAPDAAEARRRALADPSPHPDLVWLSPPGTQHLVEEVRERVIAAAAYRPFEGGRRVFVIEAAEAMAEESQNALLKTLEEPAAFAHMVLVSSEPEALLDTVRSRCQPIRFSALSPDLAAQRLEGLAPDLTSERARALARIAGGDVGRAAFLAGPEGSELRDAAEECARAAVAGVEGRPWRRLLAAAESAGARNGAEARERLEARAAEAGEEKGPQARRRARETEEGARRAARAGRTAALDLGLALIATWLRDLAALASDGRELVLNADRADELESDAEGLDPRRARQGAELVMDTRRRLTVNVNEELALEALVYRLAYVLAAGSR